MQDDKDKPQQINSGETQHPNNSNSTSTQNQGISSGNTGSLDSSGSSQERIPNN